jgi:hypothetical protein
MRTSYSDGANKWDWWWSSADRRTTGSQDISVERGVVCQKKVRAFPKRSEIVPNFNEGWLSHHVNPRNAVDGGENEVLSWWAN